MVQHVDVLALLAFISKLGYSKGRLPDVPLPEADVHFKRRSWQAREARQERTRYASLLTAAGRILFDVPASRTLPEHMQNYIARQWRPDQKEPLATWRRWLGAIDPRTHAERGYGAVLIDDTKAAIYMSKSFQDHLADKGLTMEAYAERTANLYEDMGTDSGKLAAHLRQGFLLNIEVEPQKDAGGRGGLLDGPYTPPALPGNMEDAQFEDVGDE